MEKNLFELTEDQIGTSKMMYDGKILKCLVTPYHSYKQMEEMLEYSPTTFLFPERDMSVLQVKNFISMVVGNPTIVDEIRIITTSQNIIMDMVDHCVRILTEGGDIVECPEKTFMANIHTIRHDILENEDHQISVEEREMGRIIVGEIITEINHARDNNTTLTKEQFEILSTRIKHVGERIIRIKLQDMASEITVEGNSFDDLLDRAKVALAEGDVETAKSLMSRAERM